MAACDGNSKLTGEYLSRLTASHYGIKVACVRPFSRSGEDQDLTYPTPAIAFRVARGDDPVVVWGTGEQGRDFVHIEDCITAMMRAIDRIHDGSAVNISTGQLTTFLEVAAKFIQLAAGQNARPRRSEVNGRHHYNQYSCVAAGLCGKRPTLRARRCRYHRH
jgi:nucleoside-diphosphate-sugar epimerase